MNSRTVSIILFLGLLAALSGQPSDLTTDQKLAFQTARAEYYLQAAKVNNLQAEFQRELSDRAKQLQVALSQQSMALSAAKDALTQSCPGELTGLDKDQAECKPKPQTDKPKEGAK